ncbi:MAG: C-type lectin domain-containing protein [Planctomycetota bacterium]
MKIAALALVSAVSVAPAFGATFVGSFEGHDYFITDTAGTLAENRVAAVDLGGTLVAIGGQAEQDWLFERLGTSEKFYIGFSDEVVEGAFAWDSGEEAVYTNWASNEPNDHGSGEDYAVMNWNSRGEWNDIGANYNARGIIEVVPTPGTAAIAAVGLGAVARRRRDR